MATNNPTPGNRPTQSPEDAMKRMAGIPRTDEERAADQEQLEAERERNARRTAGVGEPNQAKQPDQPRVQSHTEQERQSSTPREPKAS